MMIAIIAAVAEKNFVIGDKNRLIWRIPEDLKRFRKLTTNHSVIMGRKTYQSIGRALPKRINIILTRNKNFVAPDCVVLHSLKEALRYCKKNNALKVFIIGGAKVYQQALPFADRLYLTWVKGNFRGDAFFPKINWRKWKEIERKERGHYSFCVYQQLALVRHFPSD